MSLTELTETQSFLTRKTISVFFAGSSEAGESYQNALPCPHSKAWTISIAEGLWH